MATRILCETSYNCSNKGPLPLIRGNNFDWFEICCYFILRRVPLKQFGKKAETSVEGSSVSVYFKMLKSLSLGEGLGKDDGSKFKTGNVKHLLPNNQIIRKAVTCMDTSSETVDVGLLKSWS